MSLGHHLLMVLNLPEPSELSNIVALRLIRYASHISYMKELLNHKLLELCCLDCGGYPRRPITGFCGHTRCTICIVKRPNCPCRAPVPPPPPHAYVDVVVRNLLGKMLSVNINGVVRSATSSEPSTSGCKISRIKRCLRRTDSCGHVQRTPITIQKRYGLVRELIRSKNYKEAVPHLAIIAASKRISLRSAYVRLLAQVIDAMCMKTDPRILTPELVRGVRRETAAGAGPTHLSDLSDLDCIICCNRLRRPVTIPCGHTFCKFCIKRCVVNAKRCPLCCHSLTNFALDQIAENQFINTILALLPVPEDTSIEDEFMPVFNCIVAFPSVPCHLVIIDLRACHVVRRILDAGSRTFGMVGYEGQLVKEEFGTVLEVKDCVQLKDGCFILSTIGVSRFKILEKIMIDGVMMARVEKYTDIVEHVSDRKLLFNKINLQLIFKTIMEPKVGTADIEAAFGSIEIGLDLNNDEMDWWRNPEGPNWLWWLVAVLPLPPRLQVIILSTNNLRHRMAWVSVYLRALLDKSEFELSTMIRGKVDIKEL